MEFSTILLFIITCVIIIYFTWNFLNNRNGAVNSKHANDIRYYELKSKYEFLVAVVSLVTAVAVFYGLGTKKDIEQNIKSEFTTQFEPTRKRVLITEKKITGIDSDLKNAQQIITAYYNSLKEIDSKQKAINTSSQRAQGKFKEFEGRIDDLNKKNILKKSFYLIDNIKVDYSKVQMTGLQSIKFRFDTLTTTLDDRLPKFKKPPIIVAVSDVGFGLHVFDVTTETFQIFVDPQWFSTPKNGMLGIRLIVTEGE